MEHGEGSVPSGHVGFHQLLMKFAGFSGSAQDEVILLSRIPEQVIELHVNRLSINGLLYARNQSAAGMSGLDEFPAPLPDGKQAFTGMMDRVRAFVFSVILFR